MAKRPGNKNPGFSVTFWGAARTVTGSMHLVEAAGKRFLLDCGLFQGKRSEARQRNRNFPFDPHQIDAVILSHAHIDHCGNLPNLVRQGFDGPIYCTPATRDLLAVMLADSAKIQEEDAAYLNRKRGKHEPPIEPLYSRQDMHRAVRQCQAIPYDRLFDWARGIQFKFVEAGHLLGSAMIALKLPDSPPRQQGTSENEYQLTFTGDLGRRGLPILRDPAPVPPADVLISESTYGGRVHEPVDLLAGALGEVVKRTADRGGKLLIPAFSLGRTQTIVYFLHQLMTMNLLPPIPIYVDSPLAVAATEVFRMHPECFDDETANLLADVPDLFGQARIRYVRSVDESKALNRMREPCILIAASGMCESGRILHHLKNNLEDPRNTILIIGYQAPDTLGWRLVKKLPEVRIYGRIYRPQAEIKIMNGFSAHADRTDFEAFLGPLAGQTRSVRLVHGELDQAEALATLLREKGFADVGIPDRGESFRIENEL